MALRRLWGQLEMDGVDCDTLRGQQDRAAEDHHTAHRSRYRSNQ
jgi:hypothetical protein